MRSRIYTTVIQQTARWMSSSGGASSSAFAPKKLTSKLRVGALGLGAGIGLGGYYGYREYMNVRHPQVIGNEVTPSADYILENAPPFGPSRRVVFPNDKSGLKITLYQYQTCPFCCKVRAFFNFYGISYDIVEVNPVMRTQIKWSKKYRKVPILIVETPQGEILQLNDSSVIISALASYVQHLSNTKNEKERQTLLEFVKSYPAVKFQGESGKIENEILNKYSIMKDTSRKEDILEARKWRQWADNVFVHTLSPNIYRTLPEAIESFKNFDKVGEWEKNFATWERTIVIYVGAVAMWMIGKKLQKRHNLKKDVRESLYDESNFWLKSIKKNGKGEFMGGKEPNLSDLAVYGVLSSIEGCQAFDDLAKHSPIIFAWYRKVQAQLKTNNNAIAAAQDSKDATSGSELAFA